MISKILPPNVNRIFKIDTQEDYKLRKLFTLISFSFNKYGEGVEHALFLKMVDGQITYVSSGNVCTICGVRSTKINNIEKLQNIPVDESYY